MTKRELVAPPIGTIYRLSRSKWYTRLREDEYWQVERRTEKLCGYANSSPTQQESRYSA